MGSPFLSYMTTYKMFWDGLVQCSAPNIIRLKERIYSALSSPDHTFFVLCFRYHPLFPYIEILLERRETWISLKSLILLSVSGRAGLSIEGRYTIFVTQQTTV